MLNHLSDLYSMVQISLGMLLRVCILTCRLLLVFGFKPYELREEGRTVPAWTEYKYFQAPETETIVREYILQEQDQRTYLLCPKGTEQRCNRTVEHGPKGLGRHGTYFNSPKVILIARTKFIFF